MSQNVYHGKSKGHIKSMDWFLYDRHLRHERDKWLMETISKHKLQQLTA